MQHAVIKALSDEFGPDEVRTENQIDPRYRTDWSCVAPALPLALLRPISTSQVAAALRICRAHGVAVVPQGGLTGLAGGAVPDGRSVALSLERMNRIDPVNADAATVTVQAGATLQAVQEAALAAGLVFGVDLGARGSCQIGGNLATNAGGNGVVQFGMMREQALGLEVVLADGTVLDMLRPMLKNNTGYDLKHWFIGSEGTLGVITGAVLRLHPAQRAKATVLAALPDYASAMALLRRLKSSFPSALSAFELMWEDFFALAINWKTAPPPFERTYPFAVIAEVTGQNESLLLERLQQALESAMDAGEVLDAVVAQSQAQAATLWRIREATAELPTQFQCINFDISLPIDGIGDFAERCVQALSERWPGQRSVRFGHLGDGNLHLTTDARSLGEPSFEQAEQQVERIVYDLLAQARGSVSAEHGIGLHKKPYLPLSRSLAELAAMRAIKQALDPMNLLNPGKVFDMS